MKFEKIPTMTVDDHWSALEEPWAAAITLAWEAYAGGNIGVGAALTDPVGHVVAAGRNRVSDREAPAGRLRSTFIAHAEIDVLAQLTPGEYQQYTLWTTLEPCLLYSTAIVMSNVGNVNFAARDRLWDGISRLAELNEFVASRWPARQGPLTGPISVFCELLPLLWFLERKPNGTVVQKYGGQNPRLLEFATSLAKDARLIELKEQSLRIVLQKLWADLAAVDSER